MSYYRKQICKHVITPKESAEMEVWTANYGSPEQSMKSYPSWAVGVGGGGAVVGSVPNSSRGPQRGSYLEQNLQR